MIDSPTISPISPPWRIRLFGSLQVVSPNGTVIAIPSKKTGELLAFLALHPSRAHSREKLGELIWGDSDVGDTRTRLRQEIAKLRALFEPEAGSAGLVLINRDNCILAEQVEVDVNLFENRCLRAAGEADCEVKRRLYLEATALYTSDLLPQYEAGWIVGERARIAQIYSRALLELAEAQRFLKDFSGAEKSLTRLLAHDSMDEDGHIGLMRLYAELGQPTRVQRQFQQMERALIEGLGVSPTGASQKLAAELREAAGQRATAIAVNAAENHDSGLARPAAYQSPAAAPVLAYRAVRTRQPWGWRALLALAAIALCAGLFRNREAHTPRPRALTPAAIIDRHKEKWTYYFAPRPGEKPNAEGRAIVADETGICVTGLIQTDTEDADILTVKLSPTGKQIWADRYSSPEHDCDRAFSACFDGSHGLFVAGETYVPQHSTDTEGWHLVVLHYSQNGNRLWVRRSPMITQNRGEFVQVASDMQGGCYVGGTALDHQGAAAAVLHYDSHGNLLWTRLLREGTRSFFSRFAANSAGAVYLCGEVQNVVGNSRVKADWLVACLNPDGTIRWKRTKTEVGTAQGGAGACRLALDQGGNVLVANVVYGAGVAPNSAEGLRMAIQKYSPDGETIWERVAADSGPAVVVDGISLNLLGDVVIGGTERNSDGNWNVVIARYDTFGNSTLVARYPAGPGEMSASLSAPFLFSNEGVVLVGQTCAGAGVQMREECTTAVVMCKPDGAVLRQMQFNSAPGTLNVPRDCVMSPDLILTGRTGPSNGHQTLMVVAY